MRILYFTRDYTPHDYRFLSALAQTEHQVFSLRLERRGLQREDRPLPPEVEQIPWRGGRRPARRRDAFVLLADLKRVIRQVKPHLIHAGSLQTAALFTALAGFRPLVSMSWGSDILVDADKSPTWRWATRFTLGRTAVLVGDCQAVRQKAIQFGFPGERIVLFPWGVDLTRFSPTGDGGSPQRYAMQPGADGTFTLLSLRSWEPMYGVDVVVKAFIEAARQVPDLRLFLLGSGSQAAVLRQLIEQSGLQDRVQFGGQVSQDDLLRYYRAADLYLSASHSDGSSVSLLEALACGLPALISDIPGNREWITPGQNGWLFPDGNAHALAEGICQAARQPERLVDMRRAARALAEQRADWSKNFQELLRAYKMAVSL
jgi:L-malate glycosyltransferase